MNQYWAKLDQSYEMHVTAVYVAWKDIVTAKSSQIKILARKVGFSSDRFLQSSLLTVVLHDIGKLCVPFQRMIQARREGKHFDLEENYRHELVSFCFAMKASYELSCMAGCLLGKEPLDALAVVGHHKRLNTDLYSFERERTFGDPVEMEPEGLSIGLKLAEKIFKQEGFKFPLTKFPDKPLKLKPYNDLNRFAGIDGIFYKVLKRSVVENVRDTYLLLKGILHEADWYASSGQVVNYSPQYRQQDVEHNLRQRCANRGIRFTCLSKFQQELSQAKGNVIAVAPTGSGKTEAALLWARNNLDEMGGGKLLYLLPTMVTSNSIYERLQDYLGEENVGLTHSTATYFLKEQEEEDPDNIKQILFCKSFNYPATVATIDQLLTSGFNTGHWTVKEANAAQAVIVIDEIHAYDVWTLGLIQQTIYHLTRLGAKFLLMSATMPDFLVSLFRQALPCVTITRDVELLEQCRSRYVLMEQPIEESLELIDQNIKIGKRVLIVVNNVARCQAIYSQLRHLNPICYHSKFILRDRKKKEELIEDARLLVATQVVEVSLDIDFDILFTECAPPDAIAQRAGRINRYRKKSDSTVYLFPASELSGRIYDPNVTGILDRTWNAFSQIPTEISEAVLISIVEQVYKDMDIVKNVSYQEAYNQYETTQKRLFGILDNVMREDRTEVTRQEKFSEVAVIPVQFKDELKNTPKPYQRQAFELKLPTWYVMKHKDSDSSKSDIIFCDIDYSFETGAILLKDKREKDPASLIV